MLNTLSTVNKKKLNANEENMLKLKILFILD